MEIDVRTHVRVRVAKYIEIIVFHNSDGFFNAFRAFPLRLFYVVVVFGSVESYSLCRSSLDILHGEVENINRFARCFGCVRHEQFLFFVRVQHNWNIEHVCSTSSNRFRNG